MNGVKNKIIKSCLVFTAIIVVALFLFTGCSMAASDINSEPELSPELTNLYRQAVTSPLEKAVGETRDVELAQFSRKLLAGYNLDNSPSRPGKDAGSISSLLPDIKNINKAAMEMPLKEAGKTLTDPELSEFYNSFIERIGVDN